MASLSQRRAGARNGARATEAAIREELDRQAAARETAYAATVARRKDARAAEEARRKLTAEDLANAVVVRDEFGWHKVVRVSAKSVTVETAYSWTDRIPLARIIEGRAA